MRWRARLALATTAATIGLAAMASAASAATIDGVAVRSEVVEDTPWALVVRGKVEAGRSLYLAARVKPSGGRPCARVSDSDDGTPITSYRSVTGSGSWTTTLDADSLDTPGSYLVCTWLMEGSTLVQSRALTVGVRQPRGSVAFGLPSGPVRPDEPATIAIRGSSELKRRVWTSIKPASGGRCATSYEADTGEKLGDALSSDSEYVQGTFGFTRIETPEKAGQYLLCAYLGEAAAEPAEAAAQAILTAGLPRVDLTPPGAGKPIGTPRRRGRLVSLTVRGKLGRPAGLSRRLACRGNVTITVNGRRKGRYRVVTTRKAKISRSSCRYRKTVRFRRSKVKGRKVRIVLEFPGNSAVMRSTYRKTLTIR